jgi:triacylglycerol lipase
MFDEDKPNYFKEIAPPYLNYKFFKYAKRDSFRFRHDATELNMVNAWWLCEASILSYSNEASVREEFDKVKFEVTPFSGKSTQCYVASNNDLLILVFRGTEIWGRQGETNLLNIIKAILADVITDAKIRLIDSGQGGKVHQGFKEALDDVWEGENGLCKYLKSKEEDGRTFWFTGHSLGAALATLAWKRYGNSTGSVPGLYTFGSPRVGDLEFGKGFEETYRFVNNNDIVTKVPPPLDYRHVGCLQHLSSAGVIDKGSHCAVEGENGFKPGSWSFLNSREGMNYFYDIIQKAITASTPKLNFREENGTGFATLIPRAVNYFNTMTQRAIKEIPSRLNLQEMIRAGLSTLIPKAILDHVPTLYANHIKKNIP